MSTHRAQRLAQTAQSQAVEAVNVIQRQVVKSDEDRYREYLALSQANLAEAFVEFLKSRP